MCTSDSSSRSSNRRSHRSNRRSDRRRQWQGMNWIRQEKRLAIYMRDGLACCYCGHAVEDGAQLTLDHLLPWINGGSNAADNLVTACHVCNSLRADRTVTEFCAAVAGYLGPQVSAADLEHHVWHCASRSIDVAAAKEMIARRGSAARVLQSRLAGDS